MFKKITITTALATGVILGSPFQSEASTQSDQGDKFFTNIQTNQQIDQEQLNQWFNRILSNYEVQWDKKQTEQPTQEETQKQQPTQKETEKQQPTQQPEQKEQDEAQQEQSQEQEQTQQDEAQATPTTPQQNETTQQQESQQEQKQGYELSQYEQKVVELTNEKRAEQGLSPLKIDKELSKVARKKSQDMAQNNYFSHNSPTYGSPFDMMKEFGVEYRTAGENIAKGQRTPQEVVNSWMNSSGHRKNIMNENFTHIGVGFVEDGNVWTQQFIGK